MVGGKKEKEEKENNNNNNKKRSNNNMSTKLCLGDLNIPHCRIGTVLKSNRKTKYTTL
jgi:hypothetical protein